MAERSGDPLLSGIVAGREEAFAALYAREGAALFRVAFALLRSRADAEDVVQDVFVGLAQARATLTAGCNLRAYLFTSLRHAAARAATRRRFGCGELLPEDLAERQPATLAAGPAAQLEKALAALPSDRREVIGLKIDAELTFREIAAVLGISPNTAASRYRYALAELRDILGEHADE